MIDDNNQNQTGPNNSFGQGQADSETERRNRENETGEQSESLNGDSSQSEQSQSGQADHGQSQSSQIHGDQTGGQSGTGFVGSSGDDTEDYLTKGAQEFAPDGQGASDSNAGLSDIETGQAIENDNSIEGESNSDY